MAWCGLVWPGVAAGFSKWLDDLKCNKRVFRFELLAVKESCLSIILVSSLYILF